MTFTFTSMNSADVLCQSRYPLVFCAVPVPGPRVFHWCRTAEETANQAFTINRCPCDQVIRIQSAEIGFSDQCAGQNVECTNIITDHPNITKCNGERSCSISQNVLNYLPPDKLCDQHQHGNFIKITYDCTNGKLKCLLLNLFNSDTQLQSTHRL